MDIPIISSEHVSDAALLQAADIVAHMLVVMPGVRKKLVTANVRVAIIGEHEKTTDIPEYRPLKGNAGADDARGFGATTAIPVASGAEENLLCYPGDPYVRENILVHEFGHVIHEMGMNAIDATFDKRLRETFDAAQRDGLWKNTYAASNYREYWAEGVQSWFDTNDANIDTREKLRSYDLRLAKLLDEVFHGNEWRYSRPAQRAGMPHLAGFDAGKAPRFFWRKNETGGGAAIEKLETAK